MNARRRQGETNDPSSVGIEPREAKLHAAVARTGMFALEDADLESIMRKVMCVATHLLGIGWGAAEVLELLKADDESLIQSVVQGDESVAIEGWNAESEVTGADLFEKHSIRSAILAPISGCVGVYSLLGLCGSDSRSLAEGERKFVETLACLLAKSVERRLAESERVYADLGARSVQGVGPVDSSSRYGRRRQRGDWIS